MKTRRQERKVERREKRKKTDGQDRLTRLQRETLSEAGEAHALRAAACCQNTL